MTDEELDDIVTHAKECLRVGNIWAAHVLTLDMLLREERAETARLRTEVEKLRGLLSAWDYMEVDGCTLERVKED